MRFEKTIVNRSVLLAARAALLLAGPLRAGQPGQSPVKVFILAGQSNMQGQGVSVATSSRTERLTPSAKRCCN